MPINQGVLTLIADSISPGDVLTLAPPPPVATMRQPLLPLVRVTQPWFGEGLHDDTLGEIKVTVAVEGVAQANMVVRCIHRPTTAVVDRGRTDVNGEITFVNLNRNAIGEYYVIAFSDDDYNALVYDKLTPV